ncbi:alpha/beta hydrolase family protein [Aurantiacibacter gangjinensis]|uniref:alpha/beta hydrolase family protein n=1 Tax=Aurantiacibacter gangjinensis TaxID=502682 RepID=UPI00069B86D1|nr:alpha/beta hydrolase [Aurantiacibacter gangjinensis]APE29097.1 hypothetical protein BMF35_a2268 [Aurantiacibacter gangjinensis]
MTRTAIPAIATLAAMLLSPGAALAEIYEEPALLQTSHRIPDLESRPIDYHLQRLEGVTDIPLLIVIDGSGCVGVLRSGFDRLYRPEPDMPYTYARLSVDKGGIDPHAGRDAQCTDEYHQRRTIDRAVLDHMRVLQHLRETADWWNGEIYIYGWSEGGDIGARLTAYYPGISRSVLGAMGGGLTMAQHFEDFWDCAADRVTDREACLESVHDMFQDTRDHPVPYTEQGDSNMLWRSRMWADLAQMLRYDNTPVLVVQGALDRDHTPVQSARVLINRLGEYGRANIAYCEVPDMEHGFGSLPVERALPFERGLLDWLFLDERPGGLDGEGWNALMQPNCDPDPPLHDVAPPTAANGIQPPPVSASPVASE